MRSPKNEAAGPVPRVSAGKYPGRGLGDAVARVAEPVARTLDRWTGTRLSGCPGCQARREWLNRWRF
jgi:hypothetical protein